MCSGLRLRRHREALYRSSSWAAVESAVKPVGERRGGEFVWAWGVDEEEVEGEMAW